MTEAELRQLQLQGELARAQAQASATRAEVEGISSAHLETVLRRPRAEWAKHIEDPELQPADRQSLLDALAAEHFRIGGWRPALDSSRWNTLLRLWGRNRHRAPGMIRALVLLGPICTVAVAAYSNTGEKRTDLLSKELRFDEPDGTQSSSVVGGDRGVVLVHHLGRSFVRLWRDRRGYALAYVTVD